MRLGSHKHTSGETIKQINTLKKQNKKKQQHTEHETLGLMEGVVRRGGQGAELVRLLPAPWVSKES